MLWLDCSSHFFVKKVIVHNKLKNHIFPSMNSWIKPPKNHVAPYEILDKNLEKSYGPPSENLDKKSKKVRKTLEFSLLLKGTPRMVEVDGPSTGTK